MSTPAKPLPRGAAILIARLKHGEPAKRKRGGQPGNRNALRHGAYAAAARRLRAWISAFLRRIYRAIRQAKLLIVKLARRRRPRARNECRLYPRARPPFLARADNPCTDDIPPGRTGCKAGARQECRRGSGDRYATLKASANAHHHARRAYSSGMALRMGDAERAHGPTFLPCSGDKELGISACRWTGPNLYRSVRCGYQDVLRKSFTWMETLLAQVQDCTCERILGPRPLVLLAIRDDWTEVTAECSPGSISGPYD